jgi:hypothetical protein
MTYPTRDELLALLASLGGGHLSKAALALGISWFEANEIIWRGEVSAHTAAYWQMVRREAAKFKEERDERLARAA